MDDYGESSFIPMFFHNQYNDDDYDIFEDIWSNSLAGDVLDTRLMYAMGEGIKPTFKLRRPRKAGDEKAQAKLLEKYEPLLDELIEIDEKPKMNFNENVHDSATQAKVFGRSVLAFEPGEGKPPQALKPIHPRLLGRVFVHQSDWRISSVYTYMKLKQLTRDDEMIYFVNKRNSPRLRTMWYGFSDFQRVAGQARALRETTADVAIAIVCFILRGKGHSEGSHNHDYDKVTSDDAHVHQD